MKPIMQYKCEVCGTLYADKDKCMECEKQHQIPCKIVAAQHRPKGVSAIYPPHITVSFSDGSERSYKLESR